MGKKVLIVTKYFVPHSNVDTNAVYDLITDLLKESSDIDIHVVTSASNYKTEIKLRDFDEEVLNKITIHKVRSTQVAATSRIRKLLFGLIEGYKLISTARRMEIDHVICLTNPPLIAAWAVNLLKDKKLIYWSFDLFPDAFVADGLIRKESFIYRLIDKWTYQSSPYAIMALGSEQFNYLTGKFKNQKIRQFLLPCGIHNEPKVSEIPKWVDEKKINIAYVGNIGKAHSADFLKNFITAVEKKSHIHFLMTIYGFYADQIKEYVERNNIENVQFVKSVSQGEMAYIDVHLVSLNETWTHISVPSKAVTAVCSGSALWYNGSGDSDIWKMFRDSSFYSENDVNSIEQTLKNVTVESVTEKRNHSKRKALELQKMKSDTIKQLLNSF